MAVALDRRYRFTVDQYHRMGEAGIFDADCRVELVDGVIFEMTPDRSLAFRRRELADPPIRHGAG